MEQKIQKSDGLAALILVVVGFFSYCRILKFGFTDVDALSLIGTGRFSSLAEFIGLWKSELMGGRMPNATYYRPFLSVFYGVQEKFWSLNPMGYHLVNILLHLGNAIWVYLLGRLLFPSLKRCYPFLAALFFLWHPLQVENVPAIARLGDLLGTFLIAGSLVFYLLRGRIYFLLSFMFASLALFTKEPAILIIPVIFLAEFLLGDGKKPFKKTAPFWIMAVLFLITRAVVLRGVGGYIPDENASGFLADFLLRFKYNLMGHLFGLGLAGFSGETFQQIITFFKAHNFFGVIAIGSLVFILVLYLKRHTKNKIFYLLLAFILFQMVMIHLSFFMFRYLYLTLIPFSLLLVNEIGFFMQKVKEQRRFNWQLLPGVLAVLVFTSCLWAGPWVDFKLYHRWQEAGQITKNSTDQIADLLIEHPKASTLFLLSTPFKHLYRERNYFFWDIPQTQILLEHAVQDFVNMRFPERRIKVLGLNYLFLTGDEKTYVGQAKSVSPHRIDITAVKNAQIIEHPWTIIPGRAAGKEIFELTIVEGGREAQITLKGKPLPVGETLIINYATGGKWQVLI